MKIKVTTVYNINTDKERKRIKELFKGGPLKRQLELLDLFEAGNFKEWCDKFDELPYNKKEHCSEKEFVGCDVYDFIFGSLFRLDVVGKKIEVV